MIAIQFRCNRGEQVPEVAGIPKVDVKIVDEDKPRDRALDGRTAA